MRNNHFFLIDILIFLVTPLLALEIRLDDWTVFISYFPNFWATVFVLLVVKLALAYGLGFYRRCWRYASIDELVAIGSFTIVVILLQAALLKMLSGLPITLFDGVPRSLPILDGILSCLLVGGVRLSVRTLERFEQRSGYSRGYRTLIVGAGNAGVSLVQEMQRNFRLGFRPVAFVDDAPDKLNLKIRGIPVLGNRYKIPEITRALRIDKIIIAVPSASGQAIREISEICCSTSVQTRTLPGIHEILDQRVGVSSIRDIQIEDLLRREPVRTDIHQVMQSLQGKRILITGAGGSIGSELCRQILQFHPAEIVLLGKGENSIFTIQQELEQTIQRMKKDGESDLPQVTVFVSDIRSPYRLAYAFERLRPNIIFHAAAHKHVPLMELNPPEAITSNVLGTKNLLESALQWDVEQFVMISTDKAVNPSSIMGASKRVAEMLVLQAAKLSGKPYVAVRFGNVLGSRGSVVPTFKQQIAKGGPVIVTHPDVCRYFMTIPEAVQLVLQAFVLGCGGEVFMLDMGEPIKIVDLAQDLIRLSGYEVGKDIDIAFSGLRPGEKLVEELFIPGEKYERTKHDKILIVRNASSTLPNNLSVMVEALSEAAVNHDTIAIHQLLKKLVVGYRLNHSPTQPFLPLAEDPVTVQV